MPSARAWVVPSVRREDVTYKQRMPKFIFMKQGYTRVKNVTETDRSNPIMILCFLQVQGSPFCQKAMHHVKGHNREDMQADDDQTIPCIFIMGSSTLCGRLLATFSPHNICQLHLLSISHGIWE